MGAKKQVSRAAAVCALAAGALTAPAYAVGEDLVGNTVGTAVQQVAETLPPVELPPAPAPALPPAVPAPAPSAPAPAPAAPTPASTAPAPAPPSATPASGASATGSTASAGARSAPARGASARGAEARAARGNARQRRGQVEAGAASAGRKQKASADDSAVVATAAQASETADPVVTGAQPSVDSDGSLPFTGADLALLVALGLAAMGTGLALRRVAAA